MNTKVKTVARTFLVISAFGIAMAALESAVVVYLRMLYYPGEFTVAFKVVDEKVVAVEMLREIATIVMLAAIGFIAGRNGRERFAWFLVSFAVWDVFYYVWLKVFINWPASLFDWDILFLIPFTWLGPVLAPLICSLTMVLLAMALLFREADMSRTAWSLLMAGTILILYTFMKDYASLIIGNGFLGEYAELLRNKQFVQLAAAYTPTAFSWGIFAVGELCFLTAIGLHASGFRSENRYSHPHATA